MSDSWKEKQNPVDKLCAPQGGVPTRRGTRLRDASPCPLQLGTKGQRAEHLWVRETADCVEGPEPVVGARAGVLNPG